MPSTFEEIQATVRERLNEPTPLFWSENEIHDILTKGAKDLWRDIVDLKQEHYLRVNDTDVYQPSGASELSGVPSDVHKVYLIEPRDVDPSTARSQVIYTPKDYNHELFRSARTMSPLAPPFGEIFYAITGQGAPVGPPTIRVAPSISADLNLTFSYVPTLDPMPIGSIVPVPGECDNALVAWGVAYARAKEREDRAPDATWLSIYGTEKQHLLHSLGIRQYQEPQITDGLFDALW